MERPRRAGAVVVFERSGPPGGARRVARGTRQWRIVNGRCPFLSTPWLLTCLVRCLMPIRELDFDSSLLPWKRMCLLFTSTRMSNGQWGLI